MSVENERNYFNQTLKVLSWLKSFRDADADHGHFTFQLSQHGGKLFQGRGKEDNPKKKFYIEVARRDGKRAYCCLEFMLSDDFTAIRSACFRIGWKTPNGGIKQEFQNLANALHYNTQGLDSGTVARCERQGEENVRNWLNTWLENNYSTIVEKLQGAIPSAEEFENSLRQRIQRLTDSGIVTETENGELRLSDTAFANGPNAEERNDDDEDDFDLPISDIVKELVELVLSNLQVILTGAPGTGKTYTAREVAKAIVGVKTDDDATDEEKANAKKIEEERIASVQFHPGYDYSDFVIGMKPVLLTENGEEVEAKDGKYFLVGTKNEVERLGKAQVSFRWKDGIFKKFADKAKGDLAHNYVFLIDEINRADLSRVFGELFSLLEEEYRYPNEKWMGITLPNGDYFVIPKNLYIIGTMNDIDRSVESMDFALRRRFAWYEVSAEESKCIVAKKVDADPAAKLKNAMDALNSEIANPAFRLGSEYQLGGAIFAKYAKYNGQGDVAFEKLWKNHIEIIVKEYLRGRRTRDDDLKKLKDIYDEHVRPPRQQLEPQRDAEQQPRDEQQ